MGINDGIIRALDRLDYIMEQLRGGHVVNCSTISGDLEVSVKTAGRYIAILRHRGEKIAYDDAHRTYYLDE